MNSFFYYLRHARGKTWISVHYKWFIRLLRRYFTLGNGRKDAARALTKRVFAVMLTLLLCAALVIGAKVLVQYGNKRERMVLDKLSYDDSFATVDAPFPYRRTLNALGSSHYLNVSLSTAAADSAQTRTASLTQGGVNLRVTFEDGSTEEMKLSRKYRFDEFAAGTDTEFFVALPDGYTPFDVARVGLTLTAGADGGYDDWICRSAKVSFKLGDEAVLIARDNWQTPVTFGSGDNMLRATFLTDCRAENVTYQQTKLLFSKLNELSQKGLVNFDDSKLKADTLDSLSMAGALALYLDVETVSPERNAALTKPLIDSGKLPETEDLNFNGKLIVSVTFYGKLEDGSYTKQYELDIPGKDDFEMSGASTFRMDMPEGKCVFDIARVTLSTAAPTDAWAPRFARLYLTLNYDQELEIARMTDAALEKQYGTPIFYEGLLDSPISFDLSAANALPSHQLGYIESTYGHKLSTATKSMYFDAQSYFSRQIRFYQQVCQLFQAETEEE